MKHTSKRLFGLFAAIIILSLALVACSPASPVSAAPAERFGEPGGRGGGTAPQSGTGTTQTWQGRGGFAQSRGAGYALTPLSDAEKNALIEAVEEEYGALTLYNSIIAQFGDVYPFNVIAKSEAQHASVLVRQAEKYGLTLPAQPAPAPASTYATLADACAAGAAAEIADAALYDELKLVTTRADLLQVFDNLQSASLNSHLPAFEACK